MTNTEIVKSMYEGFNRGDLGPVLGSLADNVEWIVNGQGSVPFAGRYQGVEGVTGFFQRLMETTEQDPITVDHYVEQGNIVVALGHTTGRSKQLQKQISTPFAMVFTLSGGKVTRFEEHFDTAAVGSAFLSGAQAARG